MSRIIAIATQKGGVGKTTTCVNLACALKMKGKRVLLVDCDPQGNSTSGMGVDKNSTPGAYELLIKNADTLDCIRHTPYGDVIGRKSASLCSKTRCKWSTTTMTTYSSTVPRRSSC